MKKMLGDLYYINYNDINQDFVVLFVAIVMMMMMMMM
jgi:hypothetical protein